MFVGTKCLLICVVISLASIQSKVILDIDDEEVLQIANDIHSDKEGKVNQTTKKIEKQIVLTDNKISDDRNETKFDERLPDDAVNSLEPNTDNASTLKIDDVDIEEMEVDNGTALILTPYIESGEINEARSICEVKSDIFLGVKSYSGFLTVNKTYNSNLFFWYFPIENQPVIENPWIIWLQGGPGASSMTGLFEEIGPFLVGQQLPLLRNPFSWLQNHSLVFIDNPVGTGYSFTNHMDGYTTDMATYSLHLKLAIVQLLELFPELRAAPLFVAGESYGGKYAPALAMELHKAKETGLEVNLQGIITGNGFVEASMTTKIPETFYHFSLISKEDVTNIQPIMDAFVDDIKNNRSFAAKDKWATIVYILLLMSEQRHAYNFLRGDQKYGQYIWLLERSDIKKAIHVGNIKFSCVNLTVNTMLAGEFLTSARPLYEELLDHYKVLAYCGQLDQMLPCFLESEQYRKWRWRGAEEFHKAARSTYKFRNTRSGYVKSGGNLTEVQIQAAGHMVPMDNPEPLQHLVSKWTHNQPLSPYQFITPSIILEYIKNITGNVFL